MSVQITTAMVKQYHANITLQLQQTNSRFSPYVLNDSLTGEYGFYDQIGATTAQKKTTRHGPTPLVSTPHARRRVTGYPWEWADLIDRPDIARLLTDPTSAYVLNAVAAFMRAVDDEIIAAADGIAFTGKNGETSTSFDSNMIVPVTINNGGTSLTTGLNLKKIQVAAKLLNEKEVEREDRFLAISAHQHDELIEETKLVSRDFVGSYVIEEGRLTRVMGFTLVESERLGLDTNSYRKNLFWQKNGLLLAKNDDIMVDVGVRRDLSLSKQVFVSMDFGATRMDEKRVGYILSSEA